MYEGAGGISPVFQLCINGTAVTVMFSGSGMPDVKTKVRDILTESYEERLWEKVQGYARQQP